MVLYDNETPARPVGIIQNDGVTFKLDTDYYDNYKNTPNYDHKVFAPNPVHSILVSILI